MSGTPAHALAALDGARADVVVVGAGPAGSLAARHLALRGLQVLLVERSAWPRDKVCGGCLGARGLLALRAEGLPAPPVPAETLRRIELRCGGRRLDLPAPPMVAASRRELDAALAAEAQRAGARLLTSTRAVLLDDGEGAFRKVRLQAHDGDVTVEAALVLAADGLGGSTLSGAPARAAPSARVGAGTLLPAGEDGPPPGTLVMAVGAAGYVGLVRLPDGRLDAAAALDPSAVAAQGAGPLMRALLARAGAPAPSGLLDVKLRHVPGLTRRPARPAARRLLALGDAAGFVEPFTGEGLSWALLSARAVAPLAERGARAWHDGLAEAWTRTHAAEVRRHQRLCAGLAAWLRHPRLVGAGLGLAAAWPGLARAVLARLQPRAGEAA